MKFSIITPSLNQGKYIEDTIISVLNQDYKDFEHLVIDGGSNDETVSILKKYNHLSWVSEKDRGQAHAINKGFEKANGDIIAWINSDDYYEKNVFGGIAAYFEANPDCMVLYGDITFVDKTKKNLGLIEGDVINHQNLIRNPDIVRQPSTFWRKEILCEFKGVDENYHLVMDFDFFLRISTTHKFHYYHKNLSYYRYYNENKSLSMAKRQLREIYNVYKKNNISFTYPVCKYLSLKYLHSRGL
ncbi:MAG: glycosyltransferase family 2 protein [Ignavibacteriaceae bacterium]